MSRRLVGREIVCLTLVLMATPAVAGYQFDTQEEAFDLAYDATPIDLTGRIVDESGTPVAGADISLIAWGDNADNDGRAMSAAGDGTFLLSGLKRRAALVRIASPGSYVEIRPADLQRPPGESSVDLGDIALWAQGSGRVRLTFAGDTMHGRRFFDNGILDSNALTSTTEALYRFVGPMLEIDDHTSINLESPVTTDPPPAAHSTKSYVFFSRPQSIACLPGVGIDSVSLGNNHLYDYLEDGAADTTAFVSAAGLGWFGAGMDETGAKQNRYYTTLNNIDFAFQGFDDMVGYSYAPEGDPNPESYYIIAMDSPAKAGALQATTSNISDFVRDEAPTRFTIPVLHAGSEYSEIQTNSVRAKFKTALDNGAGLVAAHHPHTVHGVGTYDPGDGPRFILGSLGNFIFDQDRFETFRSYLAVVDIDTTNSGPEVVRLQLVPIRLDGYIPRLLVGEGLERMARHVGHLSTAESSVGDGIEGAAVFAENGRIVAYADAQDYTSSDTVDTRVVAMSGGATGTVEFLPQTASDSLAHVQTDTAASCQVGRDLLAIGGFEENDVDDSYDEGDLWDQSSYRYVQNSVVHRGRSAMVLMRKDSSSSRTTTWMVNSIEVEPGSDLSITGFVKGDNGGDLEVRVRWMSGSSTYFYTTGLRLEPTGTRDWEQFNIDLTVPNGADRIKVYFRHYPPASGGEGYVYLDDLALVEWDDQSLDGGGGASLATPNDWGYVRCDTGGGQPSLGLDLTHRAYQSR